MTLNVLIFYLERSFPFFPTWRGKETSKQKSKTTAPKNISLVSKSITDVTISKKESLKMYSGL